MPESAQSPVQAIADRLAALYKAHYGRGPTAITVHVARDAVIAILQDVNTPAQDALIRFGAVDVAALTHHRLQAGMEAEMRRAVEAAVGRSVHTYIPGFNAAAGATTDAFLLAPDPVPAAA